MKKVLFATIVAAVLAGAAFYAFADDDAAYSANAVGVIKYTVPPKAGFLLISLPLHPLNNTNWVWGETSLAQQLDRGSMVYFWDTTKLGWASYQKKPINGKWADEAANRVIQPGEAFFVRSATTNLEPKVISLLGELPTEDELEIDVTGGSQLDLRGITRYPVGDATFGDTSLTNLSKGSKVYFWDTNSAGWATYTRKPLGTGAWPAEVLQRPYQVGEGVFIQESSSGLVITNTRPFDWD